MKKARLALTAIATIAIFGGVFASRVKGTNTLWYTNDFGQPATLSVTGYTLRPTVFSFTLDGTYYTAMDHATASAETIYLGN